ncbi:MAG: hypothetical protein HEP71_02680 [Roseivirga sp.]|nr:hypothetical protein [Roseivirga sp.]
MSEKHRTLSTTALLLFALSLPLSTFSQSKDIPVFEATQLSDIVASKPTSTHIFSFWATWCAPCLKEINLIKSIEGECDCNLTLHFVNVEEEIRRPKALKQATKRDFLDQLYFTKNANSDFYNQIDSQWTGTFPALLIIDPTTGKRWFFNQLTSRKKLTSLLDSISSR